jgi:hypothetical protein
LRMKNQIRRGASMTLRSERNCERSPHRPVIGCVERAEVAQQDTDFAGRDEVDLRRLRTRLLCQACKVRAVEGHVCLAVIAMIGHRARLACRCGDGRRFSRWHRSFPPVRDGAHASPSARPSSCHAGRRVSSLFVGRSVRTERGQRGQGAKGDGIGGVADLPDRRGFRCYSAASVTGLGTNLERASLSIASATPLP